ncbi:hypothetical protein EW146_g947 [Bondarzewia mesenterica]|uniref:GLTSCR protein conserved domain-containing protein n=1 Tax=Bondarzewia mesenterica TaxID=1095465 RepID=A0A4V3XG83_9AGAM|nr:hypothetical protein EW146_g947 [Bondarzewia mesenterica]
MSSLFDLSYASTPTTTQSEFTASNVHSPFSAVPTQTFPSAPSSSTVSSTAVIDHTDPSAPSFHSYVPRKRSHYVSLTPEEEQVATRVSDRIAQCLTSDQIDALFPDVTTPFHNTEDVVRRLLPYHIFQHPREDLGKGKGKATENDLLKEEIAETQFALECFKRKKTLQNRFRRARLKSGEVCLSVLAIVFFSNTIQQRTAPDDQAYHLAHAILESDRVETASLTSELRNARTDLDKLEREKRLSAIAARPTYYTTQPSTPVYTHHYRSYHYPYAQAYTTAPQMPMASSQPPSTYTFSAATFANPTIASSAPRPTPTPAPMNQPVPAAPLPQISGAIPVQLPVSSLPTLHALGIFPVPANSAAQTPDGQPPPAILRSSSANGTQLNLEINVSLLQAAQMSGLALVLNSIMRNPSAAAGGGANQSALSVTPSNTPSTVPYTFVVNPQPRQVADAHTADSAPPKGDEGSGG